MAKAKWHLDWKVLAHEPLRKLEPDLWEVTASVPGMPLRRRMTLVRLSDGRLVVHNAVSLEDDVMAEILAWGPLAFLVVPNHFHRLDAFAWKTRFPELQVIAGERARKKVGEAVPVAGGVELLPADGGLSGEPIAGDKCGEMAFVKTHVDGGKTLVLNDILFNEPHHGGFTGFVFRILGSTGGPRVTRIMKLAGISDKKATKAHLLRLAALPGLRRIIMSHGDIIERDAATILTQAAESYL